MKMYIVVFLLAGLTAFTNYSLPEHVVRADTRDSLVQALQQKIKKRQPLVVHILVPLCDNDHQGIVPVNKQLGDGLNLKTNLYWGAGYGIKSYFKKLPEWKLMPRQAVADTHVLERAIFHRTYSNGARVWIVADAYRGDAMKHCMRDFFLALSGRKKDTLSLEANRLPVYSGADLLLFNGHDGLMDDTMRLYAHADNILREAAVIACFSYSYFSGYFQQAGAYPLITTNGLLAPEAYATGALIDKWAMGGSGAEIRKAVAAAYHGKHPSSSANACLGLFRTGWKN